MNQSDLDKIFARNPDVSLHGEDMPPIRHRKPKPLTEPEDRLSEPDDAYAGKESDLQREAEKWLKNRGYKRRSPKNIQKGDGGLWLIHINEAEHNPIILDLLLLDSRTGEYKEIELKVSGGRLSPDQRALCLRQEGEVCWNLDQFCQVVEKWERSKQEGIKR